MGLGLVMHARKASTLELDTKGSKGGRGPVGIYRDFQAGLEYSDG